MLFRSNLNLSYRLPQPSGNAWILLASASNTRGFLPYLPLPGAGYFFSSSNWKGLLGFPFGLIFWTPSPIWTVSAFFFPIRYGELKITYGQPRSLQAFSQISFRGRSYWLSDRSNDKERLFAEEGVAQAGLSAPVYRGVILEFSGGWAFARSYFLAEKISEKNSMLKFSPDNGAFANLKLGIFLR